MSLVPWNILEPKISALFYHNHIKTLISHCFTVSFFDYSRGYLKQLVSNLNAQKDKIKKSGITVDGKKYHIKFTGIVNAGVHEC